MITLGGKHKEKHKNIMKLSQALGILTINTKVDSVKN